MEIEEGQQVLAAPDDGLAESYASNEVGTKIIVGEASLVQLVLLHEDGSSEVLNTTDEHPFHVADTAAWTRADQLIVGDELSTITGTAKLQSVIYTTERVPVYNLSIPGSPTYYVGEHGVWVHNCLLWDLISGRIRGLPKGRSPGVFLAGSSSAVKKLFGELTEGLEVLPHPSVPGGSILKTLDGGVISFRPVSKSGGAALDLKLPNGRVLKVHE